LTNAADAAKATTKAARNHFARRRAPHVACNLLKTYHLHEAFSFFAWVHARAAERVCAAWQMEHA
jgi:hypothetical protein